MSSIPDWLLSPFGEFCDEFEARMLHGRDVLSNSRVAVVGLARNCGRNLEANMARLQYGIAAKAGGWKAFVCENDSTDNTKSVIQGLRGQIPGHFSAITRDLGRKHRPNEYAGPRTQELAEYRAECQEWVRRTCGDFEYTIAIDWDAWGGWTNEGAMTGFSYIAEDSGAYGSASISLLEHPTVTFDIEKRELRKRGEWVHYDCWALRMNSYWDDYSKGIGGWKHSWLPPIGSPPVRVCSAFGGFCIYRTSDFLRGTYSGQDCEHVTFHKSIQEETGRHLYLNPSQRTIMKWIEQDAEQKAEDSVGQVLR